MDLLSPTANAGLVGVPAAGIACGTRGRVRVVAGDPDMSLLFRKIDAKARGIPAPCGDPMPQGDPLPPLSSAELQAVRDWIANGADD